MLNPSKSYENFFSAKKRRVLRFCPKNPKSYELLVSEETKSYELLVSEETKSYELLVSEETNSYEALVGGETNSYETLCAPIGVVEVH